MKLIDIIEQKEIVEGIVELTHTAKDGIIVVYEGLEFSILDETKIMFDPIHNGKKVLLSYTHECEDDTEIITNNPRANSLYKSYGSGTYLNTNNQYTVELEFSKEQSYKKVFNSKFDPFFGTVKKIRTDTGSLLDDYTDLHIAQVLHENSILAIELATKNAEEDSDEELVITKEMKLYARYKTDLDLVNAMYISIASKYGKVAKKLSTLDIEYEQKLPDLKGMIGYFEDKVKKLEEDILSASNDTTGIIVSFRKANGTNYPVDDRNSF